MKVFFIYITARNRAEAVKIALLLVQERLCACANVLDSVASIFWWEGKLEEETEAVIIAKTPEEMVASVISRVKELHSYQCPCIAAWPVEAGNEEYMEWVRRETRAH